MCLEIPFDSNVAQLRKEIAANIGIPEARQRIVWIRQMDEFKNGMSLLCVIDVMSVSEIFAHGS